MEGEVPAHIERLIHLEVTQKHQEKSLETLDGLMREHIRTSSERDKEQSQKLDAVKSELSQKLDNNNKLIQRIMYVFIGVSTTLGLLWTVGINILKVSG